MMTGSFEETCVLEGCHRGWQSPVVLYVLAWVATRGRLHMDIRYNTMYLDHVAVSAVIVNRCRMRDVSRQLYAHLGVEAGTCSFPNATITGV